MSRTDAQMDVQQADLHHQESPLSAGPPTCGVSSWAYHRECLYWKLPCTVAVRTIEFSPIVRHRCGALPPSKIPGRLRLRPEKAQADDILLYKRVKLLRQAASDVQPACIQVFGCSLVVVRGRRSTYVTRVAFE